MLAEQPEEHKIISTGKMRAKGKKEKLISLSAAFDHYESRQMEILMELKLLKALTNRKGIHS